MRAFFDSDEKLIIKAENNTEVLALKFFSERKRLKSIPDTAFFKDIIFDVTPHEDQDEILDHN